MAKIISWLDVLVRYKRQIPETPHTPHCHICMAQVSEMEAQAAMFMDDGIEEVIDEVATHLPHRPSCTTPPTHKHPTPLSVSWLFSSPTPLRNSHPASLRARQGQGQGQGQGQS